MARKAIEWPRVIVRGQSKVTIYKTKIAGAERFQLRFWELGRVVRQTSSNEDEAVYAAEKIADRLRAGESSAMNLDASEASTYRHALEACGGVPLDAVCREWAEARRRLGRIPIMQAVDDWVLRNSGKSIPLNQCVDLFVSDQKSRGNSLEYIRIAETRLDLVKVAFGCRSIADIQANDLREFIEARGGEPKTRKNYRDILVTLWRWARAEGYLPRDIQTEAERVTVQKVKRKARIEIFTPEEMRKLLNGATPNLLPVLVICGFAGVRSGNFGEISRLRWEDVKFDRNVIDVEGKTGERRFAPMQPNLAAWLTPFKNRTGPISSGVIDKAFERLAKACGVEWKHNGLRHSFGSYRVASTKAIEQTSLEMGNSPAMIRKHYLEAVHEDQAEEWFGLMPEK